MVMAPLNRRLSGKISLFSFMAALMVVVIHLPRMTSHGGWYFCEHILFDGICHVAVPFFFVVSGYFLARHVKEECWWRQAVAKRVSSLIFPYLIWCTIAALPIVFVDLRTGQTSLTISSVYGLDVRCLPCCRPYWYLRELFVFVLISPFFASVLRKSVASAIALVSGLFVLGLVIGCASVYTGLAYEFVRYFMSFLAVAYFVGGMALALYPVRVERRLGIIALIVGLGIVLVRSYMMSFLQMSSVMCFLVKHFYIPILLFGVWTILPSPPPKGCWMNVAGYSFPIYLMHWVLLRVFDRVMTAYGVDSRGSFAAFTGLWVVTIASCVVFTFMIRKSMPRMSAILFGGR